jgi:hypothetical protein
MLASHTGPQPHHSEKPSTPSIRGQRQHVYQDETFRRLDFAPHRAMPSIYGILASKVYRYAGRTQQMKPVSCLFYLLGHGRMIFVSFYWFQGGFLPIFHADNIYLPW